MALETGDVFTIRTSGGGGLGPPLERDPAAVAEDLREGRVTAAVGAVGVGGAGAAVETDAAGEPEGRR